MITLLIYVLVLLIIMGLAYWVLQMIPLPPPIRQIALVVFAVICAIVLIYLLLGLVDGPPIRALR